MPKVMIESGLVEEGKMLEEFEYAFQHIARAVVESWQQHGDAAAAKGEVNLKVTLKKHAEYTDIVTVDYQVSEKLPQRPKRAPTLAEISEGSLQVQAEIGSTKSHPVQEDLFS